MNKPELKYSRVANISRVNTI